MKSLVSWAVGVFVTRMAQLVVVIVDERHKGWYVFREEIASLKFGLCGQKTVPMQLIPKLSTAHAKSAWKGYPRYGFEASQ